MVLTGAGNLKARCLLHMVIKDNFLKTDKAMIHNAVKECLNQANDFDFTSLSLPAVGTGHLRKDAKQSAEILYSCIKDYRKRKEKTLKLIRIVILQENVFVDFKKAFEKKDPTTGTSTDLGTTNYHTIPYHTIPYHTIPYHTIPYHTIPYHTIPYHITLHITPYHTIP